MNFRGAIPSFRKRALFLLVLLALATPGPALAKSDVDFDPNLDFSKYKTFVFIGGVENLVMRPVNPELINNRVHRAVTREMTAKGCTRCTRIRMPISWCGTGQAPRSK